MAKFGFSPLERAAQSAREDILQRSENLAEAARRQRQENVYYRKQPLWHIALYALGIGLLLLFFRYLPVLEQLVPAGLEALKALLPAGLVAQYGGWIIDNLPWFHEKLYAQVSQSMAKLLLLLGGGFFLHGIISLLISSGCKRFIAALEGTGAEMQRRMDSIDEVKARLQQETATGTKPLKAMNNIRAEAEALIEKSERTIKRNLVLKKAELLLLTVLSAGLMLYTLIGLHEMVLTLGLQGRNEALLVTIVTIVTLAFYMCFIGKRLCSYFPRLGKWLLRLILVGYALWLNAELILVHKQSIDPVSFFCLTILPIPANIYTIITNYAGPVLISLIEIGSAMGIVNTTNAAAELKADREGIVLPMTDGTMQITKASKARRLGVMTVIRPSIIVAICAALTSFLFHTAIKDSSGIALGLMALVVVLITVLMSVQGLSTNRFEMKYKRKGAKLQGMFVLLFVLLVFALSPGDSVMIFNADVAQMLAEEQQQAQQEQEMRTLSQELAEKINLIADADQFSVDHTIVYADSGELFPNETYFGISHTSATVDKAKQLVMQTTYFGQDGQQPRFEIQDYSWPAEGMEAYYAYNTWTCVDKSEGQRYIGYLKPDGSWADKNVKAGQWVQYVCYSFADGYTSGWSDYCSYQMVCQNVTALEDLGTETVNGITATHYLVKMEYRDRFGFDQYDNNYNLIASYDTANEYYNAVISDTVRSRYPELCNAFLEVVDKQYNQEDELHLWFDESGRLIRLEQDWTFEMYRNAFVWGDAYAYGELQKYGVQPVLNVQNYYYDDMVTPIPDIPADVTVLN